MNKSNYYQNIGDLINYAEKSHKICDCTNNAIAFRNMGYYHGYKGYRYIYTYVSEADKFEEAKINYSSFLQLESLYNFDAKLKTILYPCVMFIETAIKNRVLESLCSVIDSPYIESVYTDLFYYNSSSDTSSEDVNSRNAQVKFVCNLFERISSGYNSESVINHYLSRGESLPIWAVFELMTLGDVRSFIYCSCDSLKKDIDKNAGFLNYFENIDNECVTMRVIDVVKPLRDAIAHNRPIFDVRFRSKFDFKKSNTPDIYIDMVLSQFGIYKNGNGYKVFDYVVFVAYIMCALHENESMSVELLKDFRRAVYNLKGCISSISKENLEMIFGPNIEQEMDFVILKIKDVLVK